MIECDGLTHSYGGAERALDALTLSIPPGECFGLIGANGAGKTTLLRVLATLLVPSSGTARLNGHDVVNGYLAVRRLIGYMPEVVPLFPEFRVAEFLDYTAALYDITGSTRKRRVDAVIALTDLNAKRDQRCSSLSQGMRQRLYLARALVHDPAVLLLDEPTSGLDPAARVEFRQIMQELNAAKKTILISSHILPELSEFCTSVGIVERGKLVVSGRVADVLNTIGGTRHVEVQVAGDGMFAATLLQGRSGVENVHVDGARIVIDFVGPPANVSALLKTLIDANVAVISFGERRATLEEIFMKVAAFETA